MSLQPNRPEWGTEDFRRYAALSNDVGRKELPSGVRLRFSDRMALADYLWSQGWRRDVRDEDVNDRRRVIADKASEENA